MFRTGLCCGILSGLVSSSAGCHLYTPFGAFAVGAISFFFGKFAEKLVKFLHIDDPLSAFAIHGIGGFWGTLAVAFFAAPHCLNPTNTMTSHANVSPNQKTKEVVGLFYGVDFLDFLKLFGTQLFGFFIITGWSFVMSMFMVYGASHLPIFFKIRTSLIDEMVGVDQGHSVGWEYRKNKRWACGS